MKEEIKGKYSTSGRVKENGSIIKSDSEIKVNNRRKKKKERETGVSREKEEKEEKRKRKRRRKNLESWVELEKYLLFLRGRRSETFDKSLTRRFVIILS